MGDKKPDDLEIKIVKYLSQGERCKNICDHFNWDANNLDKKLSKIRYKFGATTNPQLVYIFSKNNFI